MSKLGPIKTSVFEKFLIHVGCRLETRPHQQKRKGGHKKYVREGLRRPVTIQAKREIPVMIIKEDLKTLGLSVEEFLNILQNL